jgi:hypothetical protein
VAEAQLGVGEPGIDAKTILSETDRLVVGVLTPATVIASRATSATAVIARAPMRASRARTTRKMPT